MKELEKEILEVLKELTAVESISDTEGEKAASDYIASRLRQQEYFQMHQQQTGEYRLTEDYRQRTVPYGLALGGSKKTIVLTGHYDVVGVSDYGVNKKAAFSVEQLPEILKKEALSDEARADLESGEWLFGRGTGDMKGGLAAGIALLDEYGQQIIKNEGLNGSLLFLAVPDEESFSAGMRGAVTLLNHLKEQYGLEYECLFDLEPNCREGGKREGKQTVFIGSAGKCLPVVLVQGVKAHTGECFRGINAISVLGEFFSRTELSPDLADVYEGEACAPPTWLWFKDMKEEYDVSVPAHACGYLSILSFTMTPEMILEKLKKAGGEAFEGCFMKMRELERKMCQKAGEIFIGEDIHPPYQVMEFCELQKFCEERDFDGFKQFWQDLCKKAEEQIISGTLNYPQAVISMMRAAMDFSGITGPVMIIGFAPPFYPPFHSDHMSGKNGLGSYYFQLARDAAAKQFGLELVKGNYFTGISDLSYCGLSGMSDMETLLEAYGCNSPLWGKLYTIDFEEMEKLNLPSLLLGPWSKDIHQMTERVHIESLTVELPNIIWNIIEQMFAK